MQGLRWDPLERHTCRLRLNLVEWEDGNGWTHRLDPLSVTSNGERTEDGWLTFDTLDPMVFLPVRGIVVRVTVDGWYEANDLGTSLANVDAALQAARTQLRARDEQLQLCLKQLRTCEEEFQELTATLKSARQLTSTFFEDTGLDLRSLSRSAPLAVQPHGGS
jgi:hypothetical protein